MTHFFGYKSHQTLWLFDSVPRHSSSSCTYPVLVASSRKQRCFVNVTVRMHAIPFTSVLHRSKHTHTPTRSETGDAYLSADPPGNADTGLPICWRSLRKERGKGWARERKRGDNESKKEHFDNPENCPDACGRPYINCFPNRWFVLDRRSAGASKHAAFPQLWIKWHLSIEPLGLSHSVQQTDTAIITFKQQSGEIYARLLDSEFSLLHMELIWVVSSLFHGGVWLVCKYVSWELFYCFGDAKQTRNMIKQIVIFVWEVFAFWRCWGSRCFFNF